MSPSNQEKVFKPEYARELLDIAKEDLKTAEFLLTGLVEGKIRGENFFFLLQQALEKTLKAVLVHALQPVPMVHDLGVLLAKIPREIEPPFGYEITRLTEFAAARRYEESSMIWGLEEATEALVLGKIAIDWAEGVVV